MPCRLARGKPRGLEMNSGAVSIWRILVRRERRTAHQPITTDPSRTMRFMTLVRSAEHETRPPKALMDAITNLGIEAAKAGVLVEAGGLTPTSMGGCVRIKNGELLVLDGPFAESKEVIGG